MSDLATEQRCAEALAREAGKRMLRERGEGFSVDLKAKNDLVTNVDRSVETFLTDELQALFPSDAILGEEFGEFDGDATSDRRWLIDPIDGTLNFSHGIPLSCVSIALQVDGRSKVGAIYEPYRDELFSGREGGGAFLNGRELSVSDECDLDNALLVTGFPPADQKTLEENLSNFAALTRASRGVRRLGSAALDLAYVACGRLDGFWEYGLNPWDTAAGYLLVDEAGGVTSTIDGERFDVGAESILATNDALHDAIIDILSQL